MDVNGFKIILAFSLRICTHLHLCLSVHTSSRKESKNPGHYCRKNWYVNVYLLHRLSRAFQFQIYRPLYETKTKLNVERIFLSVHKVNFHYTEWVCELGSVQHLSERVFGRRRVGIHVCVDCCATLAYSLYSSN